MGGATSAFVVEVRKRRAGSVDQERIVTFPKSFKSPFLQSMTEQARTSGPSGYRTCVWASAVGSEIDQKSSRAEEDETKSRKGGKEGYGS